MASEACAAFAAADRLMWPVELREKGAPAASDSTVDYHTDVLGREGDVSLDFIISQSRIGAVLLIVTPGCVVPNGLASPASSPSCATSCTRMPHAF